MVDARDPSDSESASAPDLEIFRGDQVTLHPSGYIAPPARKHRDDEKEEALLEHAGRFRKAPLEYALLRA
jgi:hypothetical protein